MSFGSAGYIGDVSDKIVKAIENYELVYLSDLVSESGDHEFSLSIEGKSFRVDPKKDLKEKREAALSWDTWQRAFRIYLQLVTKYQKSPYPEMWKAHYYGIIRTADIGASHRVLMRYDWLSRKGWAGSIGDKPDLSQWSTDVFQIATEWAVTNTPSAVSPAVNISTANKRVNDDTGTSTRAVRGRTNSYNSIACFRCGRSGHGVKACRERQTTAGRACANRSEAGLLLHGNILFCRDFMVGRPCSSPCANGHYHGCAICGSAGHGSANCSGSRAQ